MPEEPRINSKRVQDIVSRLEKATDGAYKAIRKARNAVAEIKRELKQETKA